MDDGGGSFLGTASAPLHKPYLCNIKNCLRHCYDPKANDVTLMKQLNLTNGLAKKLSYDIECSCFIEFIK